MSLIEVGGGPVHNRVDVSLIAAVNDRWRKFLEELAKPSREHGVNNNELKELVNSFAQAGAALQAQVLSLPAQGRQLYFKSTDLARASEEIRSLRTPGS